MHACEALSTRAAGGVRSLSRGWMHEVSCANTCVISVSLSAHGVTYEQVCIPRHSSETLARQAVCAEGKSSATVTNSDRDSRYAMLNLNELCGKAANVAFVTGPDAVVTHFRMEICVRNGAGLHLTNTRIRVIQRVNIEWHVRHEQRNHASCVIKMTVGDNDVADFRKWKIGTAQTAREFKTAAGIDQ
jgi:hypothetical protein